MTGSKLKLPCGWRYTPSEKAKTCAECGHTQPEKPGSLVSPSGREWPLIGNSGPRQEREMVEAIVAANSGGGR